MVITRNKDNYSNNSLEYKYIILDMIYEYKYK